MVRWEYGHRGDDDDDDAFHPDPELEPEELVATVAWLYDRQRSAEIRVAAARQLLAEALRIAELSPTDLRLLALNAHRPRPFHSPVTYRFGRIVPLVKKALRELGEP